MRIFDVCKRCKNFCWSFGHDREFEQWEFKKQINGLYEAEGHNVHLRFRCNIDDTDYVMDEEENTFIEREVPKDCPSILEQEMFSQLVTKTTWLDNKLEDEKKDG